MSHPDEVSFLWLKIERRTDILALTAFIIALLGTGFQLINFVRGPNVELFVPEQVTVFAADDATGAYVLVAAPMSYANTAPAPYSASVKRETIHLTMNGVETKQVWSSFGKTKPTEGKLNPEFDSDAAPFPVAGGEAKSHTTFFSPVSQTCRQDPKCDPFLQFVDGDTFLAKLATADNLRVELTSEIYKHKARTVVCEGVLDDSVKAQWLIGRWMVVPCSATPSFWARLAARLGVHSKG